MVNDAISSGGASPQEPLARFLKRGMGMSRASAWTLGLLAVLFGLSYVRLFGYFWGHWTEEHGPFGYGYFVPPSVALILWCKRDLLSAAPMGRAKGWAWGLAAFFVLGNLVAIVAAVTALQSLTFLGLVMVVPYLIWGGAKYRHLWAALLYTGTMIPWPGQLINPVLFRMQHVSVVLATKILTAMGLSPFVDGVTVHLPRFVFDVAAACAGLTILFPTVACTILTAMMVNAAVWRRVLLVLLSIPVSILTNAARITLVGVIGNSGGTDLANRLHDASGFVGVVVCVLILSGIGSLIGCGKYFDRYVPAWARETDEEPKAAVAA